ncbi:MAG: O-antigen ligase family protein [Anaerolineae bacterium]
MIRRLGTPLDGPLALFVVSALVGVWASYDRAISWDKFWLIVAAILLFYIIIESSRLFDHPTIRLPNLYAWLFLLGSAAFAVYFVTQHDWAADSAKVEALARVGQWLNRITPQLGWRDVNPNIAAGVFEIALPVGAAKLLAVSRKRLAVSGQLLGGGQGVAAIRYLSLLVLLFTCLLVSLGLLMTASRGAWLALGVVGAIFLGVWALGQMGLRRLPGRVWIPVGVVVLSLALIGLVRLDGASAIVNFLGVIRAGESAISRVELWGQTWGLIQDYYFTGAGLGVFTMVLSTYALLVHVPFLTHAHDLFLQVWVEQGLLGIVSFGWLVFEFYAWVWRRRKEDPEKKGPELDWLAWGGIAAVSIMLAHGLVDVLLYSSRELLLFFIPFALAVSSQRSAVSGQPLAVSRALDKPRLIMANSQQSSRGSIQSLIVIAIVVIVALGLIGAFYWKPLGAIWYANLGSVEQTRYELAQYKFPDHLVEYFRRDASLVLRTSGLTTAVEDFNHALALDPLNVTANQRLSEIALAQGRYDDARGMLEQALPRDPANQVTWQLLGDAYLGLGRLDDAYAYWSRVPDAPGKLDVEASVRYGVNRDAERAGWARTLAERIRAAPVK